ncbi:hypothetical protein H8M03_06730 [Sphingomonas sabuli]|uniref:Uncharacterized protein n=1 Tax=Sphingomonas sabuli TaxID=2764186 RepID=A0A7G9KZG5_9SPHN|nr:hypothetical protein [Sphingomonas sabuli]QNM81764.1 hypothetical protein H8M03_06730 [Sphingomonas sabuli]
MAVLFAAQMALGLFLMFGHPGVPWYKRAIAAFGSVGMALCVLAFFYATRDAPTFEEPEVRWSTIVSLLVANGVLAARLIGYFRSSHLEMSCFGTIGRMVGCLAVAWGVFALLAVSLAVITGISTSGLDFFYR